MLEEFAWIYHQQYKKVFPWREWKINKSLHYTPHDPKAHEPDTSKMDKCDEIGLVRAICVKELYKQVQEKASVVSPSQLLLDMNIRWSSTYVMLNHAENSSKHVDVFVYEMGLQEHNLRKCTKIDYLRLTSAEWICIGQFADLLSYVDITQQAFSSDAGTTLHLAVPALKAFHKAWSSCAGWTKYSCFTPALDAAADKIDKYYEKMTESPTYVMTMAHYLKMGAHASAPQTCIKKGKASSLKKLIHQTQSSDKDEDIRAAAPSVSAKPWQADFMKYMDMVEAAPLSGMSTIQWWGIRSDKK
ncbi:hypothetical protein BD769DRAFT_1386572 [Suillus cothurnatus]|nr:hypothetical protein BD769DRAFT_1386572 [Suillus cothurnatus]